MPTDLSAPRSHAIDARPALIEQAKGALMLHYGVDSHQAFALLLGWARTSCTPMDTITHTLLRGDCEGNPQTAARQPALMGWLEAQLRDGDPGVHGSGRHRPGFEPAPETPRSD